MTRSIALLAVMAAAAAASGCSTISNAIGAAKTAPDEFRVVTAAPLTLPPDYSLRPPRPGEARPQELEPNAEARAALFGDNVAASASQGERSLVTNAGAATVDPTIRDTIDYENQGLVRRDEEFVDRLLSFNNDGNADVALNPEAEARRLENDEAIRRATGGGDVVIERDGGGFKLPGT